MGENTNEEWVKIVEEYDDNGDGEISYEEFLNIIDKILKWFMYKEEFLIDFRFLNFQKLKLLKIKKIIKYQFYTIW